MRRVSWLVLCFSACTAADPDVSTDGPAGDTSCEEAKGHSDLAWIQSNLFSRSCSLPSCHRGSAATAGFLDLEAGRARGQLVDTASTSAGGWKRVVPGDAARSYLLVAIGQSAGPRPIDGVMPVGGPALCADKREAIQRWIEAGAPP
jgi:hypothetical protein